MVFGLTHTERAERANIPPSPPRPPPPPNSTETHDVSIAAVCESYMKGKMPDDKQAPGRQREVQNNTVTGIYYAGENNVGNERGGMCGLLWFGEVGVGVWGRGYAERKD